MNQSEIDSIFERWKKAHSKPSWVPVTGSPSDNNSTSWFGGSPCLSTTTQWPICSNCKKPMRFMIQIDLGGLPTECEARPNVGLLQLFYCSNDDGTCETWMPFSGAHAFLVSPGDAPVAELPEGVEGFAKVIIGGWSKTVDSPGPEEHASYGLKYDYDFENNLADVSCSEFSINIEKVDIDVAEMISVATPGDKLGGWPFWIQGVEYPSCPECAKPMDMFMQIDSEDNLDYMFGDSGCAHIFQCRDHSNLFGFGWACC